MINTFYNIMDSFNDVKKRQHQIHTFFQKKLKVESEKNSDVQVTQVIFSFFYSIVFQYFHFIVLVELQ